VEHHGPVVTAEREQGRVRGDAWKGGKQQLGCSLPARHNKVVRDADVDTGDGVVMAVQDMLAGCCHCAPHEMPHTQRRIQGTSHQRVPAQAQTRRVASEIMNPKLQQHASHALIQSHTRDHILVHGHTLDHQATGNVRDLVAARRAVSNNTGNKGSVHGCHTTSQPTLNESSQ